MSDSPNQTKTIDIVKGLALKSHSLLTKQEAENVAYVERMLNPLIVTRDGVPVEDQVAGLDEFKEACIAKGRHAESMERLFAGSRGGCKTIEAEEATDEVEAIDVLRTAAKLGLMGLLKSGRLTTTEASELYALVAKLAVSK